MPSVLGIALAIACVTFVRTISSSFAITGADSVTDVLDGAQLWAVPAAGGRPARCPRLPATRSAATFGSTFGAAVGLPYTSDLSVVPDANGSGLIYDTVGGSGPLTFEQNFSALFSGKVTSSTLGIMSSIGLSDEVLYFFLVESAITYLVAYLLGVLGAFLVVIVFGMFDGIRAQSASLGHADEIGLAVVLIAVTAEGLSPPLNGLLDVVTGGHGAEPRSARRVEVRRVGGSGLVVVFASGVGIQ